ncbi:recombinase family protein [Novosphingobium sp.]|jgi:site-specific DNA recombinase|uniref:recombinase family protein n=1 Tax=Novosphingobium sp. TaxID=1874826 RepID=UPI0022CCA5E8|nr:recombinase family protein [Novosphingobium sp.]MCZ8264982.1 recombinase family protein [Novosphingobium sp.]
MTGKGATTKRGKPMNKSDVYRILTNRVFLGEAAHKGNSYPGEHGAIITQAQWDAVQAILKINPRVRINQSQNTTAPLLRGLLCFPHAAADATDAGNGQGDPGWKAAEGGTLPGLLEPFPVEWKQQTGCPLP